MLKNLHLADVLAPPLAEDKTGNSELVITEAEITGAGYKVPIVDGIPDFVSFAPKSKFAVEMSIPLEEHPTASILSDPKWNTKAVPDWFQEEKSKFYFLDEAEKGLLLDIGCGQGNRATYERLGFRYLGSDMSFNSRQRSCDPPDLDLVADTHRLPLQDASIAAINSTAVIEHLYLPYAAAKEWMRVLKPGGILVGSCSFLEGEHFDSQCHYYRLGTFSTPPQRRIFRKSHLPRLVALGAPFRQHIFWPPLSSGPWKAAPEAVFAII